MRVTVVGGGNIGTQFSVHLAEKGHEVIVFTSNPSVFCNDLVIVDEDGVVTHRGTIACATNDPEEAFGHADLIILTVPASVMRKFADMIYHYADEKALIGVVPGTGGSECAFSDCISRGNTFFGIERVPAIARIVEKGRSVRSVGYRSRMSVAAIPRDASGHCAALVEEFFDIPCTPSGAFLNLTLTPSNPILHTVRLRMLFEKWHKGMYYDSVPLFYEGWDDKTSALLIECDKELESMCKMISEYIPDISVKTLREHYESYTIEDMTAKISSIKAFKGLTSPVVKTENGLVPDLNSRYFTSDFSYGLSIISQIGDLFNIRMPDIKETMDWYRAIVPGSSEFSFEEFGITDMKSFVEFYRR